MTSLRDFRRAAGYTQLELGILGGLSQGEIALVESGRRKLSGAAKVRLIRALNLSRAEVNVIPELMPFTVEVSA